MWLRLLAAISSMVTVAEILKSGQWAVERSEGLSPLFCAAPCRPVQHAHYAMLSYFRLVRVLLRLESLFCCCERQRSFPRKLRLWGHAECTYQACHFIRAMLHWGTPVQITETVLMSVKNVVCVREGVCLRRDHNRPGHH